MRLFCNILFIDFQKAQRLIIVKNNARCRFLSKLAKLKYTTEYALF